MSENTVLANIKKVPSHKVRSFFNVFCYEYFMEVVEYIIDDTDGFVEEFKL